ncbi:MAG: hypothetical protein ABSF89_16975 [Acidimicrobiales bacterium]
MCETGEYGRHGGDVRGVVPVVASFKEVEALLRPSQMTAAITMITTKGEDRCSRVLGLAPHDADQAG